MVPNEMQEKHKENMTTREATVIVSLRLWSLAINLHQS